MTTHNIPKTSTHNIRAWEGFLLSVINERIMKPEDFIQSLEKGAVMIIKQICSVTSLHVGEKTSIYLILSAWEGLRNHT